MRQARLEQSRRRLIRLRVLPLLLRRLRRDHARQPIEKPLHGGRERRLDLVERALQIAEHVRSREALDQRATEIERAELGEREPIPGQRAHPSRIHPPELRAVDDVVVDRKASGLERREVAPDRARGDMELFREFRNRVGPSGGELPEQRPLSYQFGVSTHRASRARRSQSNLRNRHSWSMAMSRAPPPGRVPLVGRCFAVCSPCAGRRTVIKEMSRRSNCDGPDPSCHSSAVH